MFNKIEIPSTWKEEYTKYPNGKTIWEALSAAMTSFNDFVDEVNGNVQEGLLSIDQAEDTLRSELAATFNTMAEQFQIDFGNLQSEVDAAVASVADKVTQAQLDAISAQLAENTQLLNDAIDGSLQSVLESELVATDIANKLNAKETEYAPRLTTVEASVNGLGNEITTKRTHMINLASSTEIPMEIHNMAGQAGSADVSSEVTHHYTDAPAKVIDNVGTGTILLVSNSRNSVNRPDQPSDFVGTGKVMQYRRYNPAISDYEIVMEITKEGNIVKTGKGSGTDTALKLTQSKDDDNLYGMTFENTKEHTFPFQFRNGGAFLTFIANAGKTMATIQSASRMTSGLEFIAAAGNIFFKANNGTINLARDGAYHQALLSLSGTTENRPTTNLTIGLTYFDTTLGKPVWYKGGAIWVDAMGTNV